MSDEEYRQEGINMQLKPINDKIKALEEWKKIEEEQHQNITKALDNFVIDAGAIGDSVYSNKLKSLENEIAESKGQVLAIDQVDAKYKQEISALKEKVNYLEDRYKESGGLRCLRDRGLIKEVLRELHELMRGLVSDLQDSNSLSKATIKCYEGKLIKNLKKLDSPKKHCFEIIGGRFFKKVSDKQTEKKELNNRDIIFTDHLESGLLRLDSEGSKSVVEGQDSNLPSSVKLTDTEEKLPKFLCTLKEQEQCDEEGSMDCLKGNSEGEYNNPDICVHGKKELERHPEPQCEISKEAKGRKETSDAKQVERFLNDMVCNVGITSVKWGPNLIKDLEGEEDFDSRDYRLIKRRDLEELIEIGYNRAEKPKVVEFLERIKEVYGIK